MKIIIMTHVQYKTVVYRNEFLRLKLENKKNGEQLKHRARNENLWIIFSNELIYTR